MPVEGPIARGVTSALRERSVERLVAEFAAFTERESARSHWDERDTMLGLTVFVDCARRLDRDPATLFGPIGATGAPWFAALFERFVRRTDVSLGVMGWTLVDLPDGPAYRFAWVTFPRSARGGG